MNFLLQYFYNHEQDMTSNEKESSYNNFSISQGKLSSEFDRSHLYYILIARFMKSFSLYIHAIFSINQQFIMILLFKIT